MSLDCVYNSGIEAYSHVVGEHFVERFLCPEDLLLIFNVIDFSIFEGLDSNIPHIIKSNCSIHPLLHQTAQRTRIQPTHFHSITSPPNTTTEIVSCTDRDDSEDYLSQI